MSDERELLEGAGHRILERMKEKPEWSELTEELRDKLREAAFDLGKLTVLELSGQDVGAELVHVRAQIASWEFRASSQARRLLDEALRELSQLLGSFLMGLVRTGL